VHSGIWGWLIQGFDGYYGTWGISKIVCTALGYPHASNLPYLSVEESFNETDIPVWYTVSGCTGAQATFLNCSYTQTYFGTCDDNGSSFVNVTCINGKYPLCAGT
jgi:hypothetical protein